MNEALKHLGEEHRLGMIRTEEFRNRRRALLESWGELDATTSPGSVMRRSMSITQTNPGSNGGAAAKAGAPKNWALISAVLLGVVVVGVASWLLKPGEAPVSDGSPAGIAKRSPELLAVMQEAAAFRNRNNWEASDTEAFLERWRSLSDADRRIARQEPSFRSLVHELEQTIAAERQALEFSPSEEGRARLERLRNFADELTGSGS